MDLFFGVIARVISIATPMLLFHSSGCCFQGIGAGLRNIRDFFHQTLNPGHAALAVAELIKVVSAGHHHRTNAATAASHGTFLGLSLSR